MAAARRQPGHAGMAVALGWVPFPLYLISFREKLNEERKKELNYYYYLFSANSGEALFLFYTCWTSAHMKHAHQLCM